MAAHDAAAGTLMVQGTASGVGKSLMVTAFCRLFSQRGVRVAPFKAQNMALNSWVTPDGAEIGRSQAVQAEACGIPPSADMNPILIKPEGGGRAQVVVLGRPIGSFEPGDYEARQPFFREVIAASLQRLRRAYDLVIIEGAGSPAEINLKDRDLVNMAVARLAQAPVVLLGDIDRGGVFAALVGTMELLEPEERARVAAFLINRFRGDLAHLEPGLRMLEQRTGVPVLGVVPHIPGLHIADEDAVSLEERPRPAAASPSQLDLAVLRLPHLSNFDEFVPLEREPGVVVRYLEDPAAWRCPDLVILPGSKCTMADLAWLRRGGLAGCLEAHAREGRPILGICGGCQMLGERLEDPHEVESPQRLMEGLRLLPLRTCFERRKTTAQVLARVLHPSFLVDGDSLGMEVRGYEIHMGSVTRSGAAPAAFLIQRRNGVPEHLFDGAVSAAGAIVGSMIHGLFENQPLRRGLLRSLWRRRGLEPPLPQTAAAGDAPGNEQEYTRLAAIVADHIDHELLARLAPMRSV